MKRFHWFEIFLVLVIVGVQVYAAFSAPHNFASRWFLRDDAYFYFKVAQNISEGHGSTFDGINLTNGYHPLWMLVCVPIFSLARFDLILPLRIVVIVLAIISAATSVLIFRLLKRTLNEPVAMLAAGYWSFTPIIHDSVIQNGLESGLVAFSVVFFLYRLADFEYKNDQNAITRSDIIKIALAALLILFSRLDTIYIVMLAGVWVTFRRSPLRTLALADLLSTVILSVMAFIYVAGLKLYLAGYSESGLAMAATFFVAQFVAFYFLGLYEHPRNMGMWRTVRQAAIGQTIAAIFSAGACWALDLLGLVTFSRLALLYAWIWGFGLTLGIRLLATFLAPAAPAVKTTNSPLEQFKSSWRTWLNDGLTYFSVTLGALSVYLVFNRLLFGTFMPVSGQIKRWWGLIARSSSDGVRTWIDILGFDRNQSSPWWLGFNPIVQFFKNYIAPEIRRKDMDTAFWAYFFGLLAIILLVVYLRKKRISPTFFKSGFILLGFGAAFHAFLYGAVSYGAQHEWYWVMEMLAVLVGASILLYALLDLLPRHRYVSLALVVVAGLLAIPQAYTFSKIIINRMPMVDSQAGQPYNDMLIILEGYTEPGSIIGLTGGGSAGYFIRDRAVINMDGLINSYDYFKAMQAGKGGDFLEKIGMTYVFANPNILLGTAPHNMQFPGRITPIPGVPAYGNKQLWRFGPPTQ